MVSIGLVVATVTHSQRVVDVLLQMRLVGTSDFLNDPGKYVVASIVV